MKPEAWAQLRQKAARARGLQLEGLAEEAISCPFESCFKISHSLQSMVDQMLCKAIRSWIKDNYYYLFGLRGSKINHRGSRRKKQTNKEALGDGPPKWKGPIRDSDAFNVAFGRGFGLWSSERNKLKPLVTLGHHKGGETESGQQYPMTTCRKQSKYSPRKAYLGPKAASTDSGQSNLS